MPRPGKGRIRQLWQHQGRDATRMMKMQWLAHEVIVRYEKQQTNIQHPLGHKKVSPSEVDEIVLTNENQHSLLSPYIVG